MESEMSDNKTHFRKVFKSPYLSAADVDGKTVLTIARVVQEQDQTKKTKDYFNVAYFAEKEIRPGEKLKPMILNVGNSNIVRKFAGGSNYIEDWGGLLITVYVMSGVKLGRDTVDGLRIMPNQPKLEKPKLTPGTDAWEKAKVRYRENGNLDVVKKHMDIEAHIEQQLIEEAMAEVKNEE